MATELDAAIERYRAAYERYNITRDRYEAARETLDRRKGEAEEAIRAFQQASSDYYMEVEKYARDQGTPLPDSPWLQDMGGYLRG